MECCVCYKNIKKSCITCHGICLKCHHKIKNNKCPICRNQMILKKKLIDNNTKLIDNNTIEVTYEYGGKKNILLKNLNRFVFGKEFKKYLENILTRWGVSYKKDFVIIDYKKYEYDEILDFKTYSKYMSLAGNQYFNCNCNFMNLIDRIIDRQNIYRLDKQDIFYIKNIINRYEYENSETRLLKYVWEREKYKVNIIN